MTDHPFSSADPAISLVVAVGENGAIGLDGELPWRISSELKHFRKVTMGKPIVMGRRTYDSLGRCLDGRLNIVITRDRSFEVLPGGAVAHSLAEALQRGREEAALTGADEIAVIGGEALFKESLPIADRLYFTEVHASPEADTWFPDWNREEWEEVSRQRYEAGPKDEHPFSIVVLERKRQS
ncbi:MAG: dihydrofolate reductase [Methyloligella sp. ZOD6]